MRNKWSAEGFKKITEASARGRETQRKKYLEDYNNNATYCRYCNIKLPYNKRRNKFCDHICAGLFNNKDNKHIVKEMFCLNCGTKTKKNAVKFCSLKCQGEHILKQHEKVFDNNGNVSIRVIKRILEKKFGHICQVCKNDMWNGKPIHLEIEHKDGNSDNNKKDNLELICPNCHAQTDTYKGKNKGNGRYFRKMRYREGKSF